MAHSGCEMRASDDRSLPICPSCELRSNTEQVELLSRVDGEEHVESESDNLVPVTSLPLTGEVFWNQSVFFRLKNEE